MFNIFVNNDKNTLNVTNDIEWTNEHEQIIF